MAADRNVPLGEMLDRGVGLTVTQFRDGLQVAPGDLIGQPERVEARSGDAECPAPAVCHVGPPHHEVAIDEPVHQRGDRRLRHRHAPRHLRGHRVAFGEKRQHAILRSGESDLGEGVAEVSAETKDRPHGPLLGRDRRALFGGGWVGSVR